MTKSNIIGRSDINYCIPNPPESWKVMKPSHFFMFYTDYAGPEITVHFSIAAPFSRQIAIGNAGPTTALQPMGAKRSFRCHLLNIPLIYKQ